MMQSTVAPPTLACTVTLPRPSVVGSGNVACWNWSGPTRRKSSAGQEEKDERFGKTRVTHNTIFAQNSPGFANFVPVLLLLALGARQLPLRLNPLEVHRWT